MTHHSPTVGIIYPGHAAEDDYPQLEQRLAESPDAPQVHLPVVISTIGVDEHTPEALLETGSHERLTVAADRLLTDEAPDALVWACTSGSFVYGWQGAHEQAKKLQEATGVPATSTSLAFARAAQALGVTRVAVPASYPDRLAAHFRQFLADAGVEVIAFDAQGIFTASEVGHMHRDEVLEMIRSTDVAEADAVLVPDTAMHSLAWIEDFESTLGKPVLTANQVSIWEGMRTAGVDSPQLPQLGALFSGQLFTPSEHSGLHV